MNFLMGLSKTYAQPRGQILMMIPIPFTNQVLAMLMQTETQKKIGASTTQVPTEMPQAFFVQTEMNELKKGKRDRPIYADCGILEHIKDKCYKLHDYPSGYTPRFKKGKTLATSTAVVNQVTDSATAETATNSSSVTSN